MRVLEQQVAKVHGKTHVFFGELDTNILIDRELHAETDCIVPIDTECRRAKKYLVCFRVGDGGIALQEAIGTLADKLTEDAPVPFIRWFAPSWWAVAIDQAVIEHVGPTITIVFVKLSERTTKPNVMAA